MVVGPTFDTWSGVNKNSRITLTSGLLTATADASGNTQTGLSVKATSGSQLVYWEIDADVVNSSSDAVSIGNASASLADGVRLGVDTNGLSIATSGNVIYSSAVQGSALDSWAQGSRLGLALDMVHNKLWMTVDGTTWNAGVIGVQNPATNTGGVDLTPLAGGPWFAGCTFFGVSSAFTANFGATAYAYTPPSGFGNR